MSDLAARMRRRAGLLAGLGALLVLLAIAGSRLPRGSEEPGLKPILLYGRFRETVPMDEALRSRLAPEPQDRVFESRAGKASAGEAPLGWTRDGLVLEGPEPEGPERGDLGPRDPEGEAWDPAQVAALRVRARVSSGTRIRLEGRDRDAGVWMPLKALPLSPGASFPYRFEADQLPEAWSRVDRLRVVLSDDAGASAEVQEVVLESAFTPYAGLAAGRGLVSLDGERRQSLIAHPGVPIDLPLTLPPGAVLRCGLGQLDPGGDLTFTVSWNGEEVWRGAAPLHRLWRDVEVDLTEAAPRGGTLRLLATSDRARGPASRPNVAFWGTPAVVRPLEEARLPSVLLILVDAMRADAVSAVRGEGRTTPRLDDVARGGVLFPNVLAASDWTRPSVTSLLTSLYPSVHGNLDYGDRLAPGRPTLARILLQHGMRTGSIVANPMAGRTSGLDQGFESVWGDWAPGLEEDLRAPELIERAKAWIAARRHEPWFLYLHLLDPHTPYDAPAAAREALGVAEVSATRLRNLLSRSYASEGDIRIARDAYLAEVRAADDAIGELLDWLGEQQEDRDLLLAVTSDHGEAFQEHGLWGHTNTLQVEETRVPLVLRRPGAGVPAGLRVDVPVSLLDVMPTILSVLGLPEDPSLQGRSLRPLWREPGATRGPVFAEKLNGAQGHLAVIDPPWKLIVRWPRGVPPPEDGLESPLVRAWLYDLEHDPAERVNLSRKRLEDSRRLLALLRRHLRVSRRLREGWGAGDEGAAASPWTPEEETALRALGYVR